jgi:hypothetical protein
MEARAAGLVLLVSVGLFGQVATISAKSLKDFAATGEKTAVLRLDEGDYNPGNGHCSVPAATAEIVSARGPAAGGKIWLDDNCALHVDLPASAGVVVKCANCVYGAVATPAVSSRGILLFDVGVANGRWSTLMDRRGVLSLWSYVPGEGLQTDAPTGRQFSVDSTVARRDGANVFTSDNDFSAATKTAPFRIGESDPGTCDSAVREMFFNTSTNTLKVCNAPNSWIAISGGNPAGCAQYSIGHVQAQNRSTAHDITLFTLPAMAKITGLTIKHSSAFGGPGIESVTVSVGSFSDATAYARAFDVAQPAGDTAQLDVSTHRSTTAAAHEVIARFSSTGSDLSSLNRGAVDIWVCAVALR